MFGGAEVKEVNELRLCACAGSSGYGKEATLAVERSSNGT